MLPMARDAWSWARKRYAAFVYPHAIYFRMDASEFNAWYLERYQWMQDNIRDPKRNIWLYSNMVYFRDQHTMMEVWMDGYLRFRRSEDAMLYRMVWA